MDEFLKTLPGLGVGGILALFIFLQFKKSEETHAATISGYHEQEKGRTDMIINVIKDNTSATTKNNTVLDALHRRLDRDEFEKGTK